MTSPARARTLVLAGALAVLLAGAAAALVLTSDHDDNKSATIALALTAGLTFVGSGLIAIWRRPDNRTGVLLAAVGYLWFLGALTESDNDWAFTIGAVFGQLAIGAFAHLLLAFPEGRLTRVRDLVVVWATYALVLGATVATGLVDETPDSSCDSCRSTIAIGDSAVAQSIVQWSFNVLALVLLAVLLWIVVGRYLHATTALRRVLGPVLAAGALTLVTIVLEVVVGAFSDKAARPLSYVFLAAFGIVPFAFLAGVLRSRLARSAVADLLLALGRDSTLRDALSRALHDPSLEVVFWLPEREIYVWHDGNEFKDEGGPRVARYVERNGQRVAAILHDPSLADDPELVDAVAEAAALWLENERLQAELRAQVGFLETIVNTAPSLLMSLDIEGRIVNFNPAVAHASGFEDPEELRGSYFWDVFLSPEDRELVRERFAANPAHDADMYENAFTNACGEELVIAWSTAPLLDDEGVVRRIVCGGLDVTVRKRRELELEVERDFADTVANTIPILLVGVDGDDATINQHGPNPAFERILGWTKEDAIGRSLLDFVHLDDHYAARMTIGSAANGVASSSPEARWLCKDGSTKTIVWSARQILGLEGKPIVLVSGGDVSELKRQEEEIRASRARIVEAGDAARRRLERNLHDGAQQRLVALSIALRLAQVRLDDDPGGAREILEGARTELAQALDELRELARGIHPAILTDRGLAAAVEALAARSPVPVEVEETVGDLPPPVEAAAYYVVAESLANVVKYAGASLVNVRIVRSEECAIVEVSDNGVGGADPTGGSGLRGLADRVEALEGRLAVESPAGEGTVVRAEIPFAQNGG